MKPTRLAGSKMGPLSKAERRGGCAGSAEEVLMKVPDCTPDGRFSIDTSEAGRLGEGAFGVCCLGFHTITQKPVAIKISMRMDVAVLEAIVQKRLKHPNVVQLYLAQVSMEDPSVSYLVMECCTGGELFDVIAEHGALHPDAAFRFFCEITSGLEYCHKSGVYHRDLKPENILLSDKGHARIADFGLAKLDQKLGELVNAHSHCGSVYYMAPEVIHRRKEGYDPAAADIWSLGIIYYTMLTGCVPWLKASRKCPEFDYFCKHGLWMPSFVPEGAAEIVCRMLDVNPATRVTSEEVMSMTPRLLASHPLRSLVLTTPYNKPPRNRHSYQGGIDFPGNVTIEDIEDLCLHRTLALLRDRANSLRDRLDSPSSLIIDSQSGSLAHLLSVPLQDVPQTKSPQPTQSSQSMTAPTIPNHEDLPRHFACPPVFEKNSRDFQPPRSLILPASPHREDQSRRRSSPPVPSSSPGFEYAAMSESTSQDVSMSEWCSDVERRFDGSDGVSSASNRSLPCISRDNRARLQESLTAAPCQIRDQTFTPSSVNEPNATVKAKKWRSPKSLVDGRSQSRLKFGGGEAGEDKWAENLTRSGGHGGGDGIDRGSLWSKPTWSGTSCSPTCSTIDYAREHMGNFEADLHSRNAIQARASVSGRSLASTLLDGGRVAPPPGTDSTCLGSQSTETGDFLSRCSQVWDLWDSGNPSAPQDLPLSEPCSLQMPVSHIAGASLPPKPPDTSRQLEEKVGCKVVSPRRVARVWGGCSGLDAGACTCRENVFVDRATSRKGNAATIGGPDGMLKPRSRAIKGYGASEVQRALPSANSPCSSPLLLGQAGRPGGSKQSPCVQSTGAAVAVSTVERKQEGARAKEEVKGTSNPWIQRLLGTVPLEEAMRMQSLDAGGELGSCTCVACSEGSVLVNKSPVCEMRHWSCLDGITSPMSASGQEADLLAEASGSDWRRAGLGGRSKSPWIAHSVHPAVLSKQGGGRSNRGTCKHCSERMRDDESDCLLQPDHSLVGGLELLECNEEDGEEEKGTDKPLGKAHCTFGEPQGPFPVDEEVHKAQCSKAECGVCVKVCKDGDSYKIEVCRESMRPQQHHQLYRDLRIKASRCNSCGSAEVPTVEGIDSGHAPVSPCPGWTRDCNSDT